MKNKLNIGIVGYGVVGQGLYKVLQNTKGLNFEIKKIAIKDKSKKRNLPDHYFTYDVNDILNDDEINTVVELIDNAEDAYTIVKSSLLKGKNVVSANKKMLAYNIEELITIQKEQNVSFLYEASACGSIPILRNLEEYYDNDLIRSVGGILNGSSNYILSKVYNNGSNYNEVLKKAQELGFAESDPSSDVEGFDALYKLIIITLHSFGTIVNPNEVLNLGISKISKNDIKFAKEKGFKIKLVAQVKKQGNNTLSLSVIPRFVKEDELIYSVENEVNGVVIEGEFYDKQFMLGKGAGDSPTGSAVLSDITALAHNYKYEYKKIKYYEKIKYSNNIDLDVYVRYENEEDLDAIQIKDLKEKFVSSNYSYIVGKVNLQDLLKNKEKVNNSSLFFVSFN